MSSSDFKTSSRPFICSLLNPESSCPRSPQLELTPPIQSSLIAPKHGLHLHLVSAYVRPIIQICIPLLVRLPVPLGKPLRLLLDIQLLPSFKIKLLFHFPHGTIAKNFLPSFNSHYCRNKWLSAMLPFFLLYRIPALLEHEVTIFWPVRQK